MPIELIIREFEQMRLQERLKNTREDKGLSREQLAEMIGTSDGTIKNWENGRSEPKISDIIMIAKVTGTNPTKLAFGDLSEIENEEQIELTSAILSLTDEELKTAKEIISALSLKSHARRISK